MKTKLLIIIISLFSYNSYSQIKLSGFDTQNPDCNKCNGSVCLNVSAGQPPFTYKWNRFGKPDTIITTTNTKTCINNLCSGYYYVTVTDANSSSTQSATVISWNQYKAIQIINPTETYSFCIGATVQLKVGNPGEYLWSTGETTSIINPKPVDFYTEYSVTITDGICKSTGGTHLYAYPYPTKPEIYLIANKLHADAKGYVSSPLQWFLNNIPIAGANDTIYTAILPGWYKFSTESYGDGINNCHSYSDSVYYSTTGIDNISPIRQLIISDNALTYSTSRPITLLVHDINGRLIETKPISGNGVCRLECIPGIYLISIKDSFEKPRKMAIASE